MSSHHCLTNVQSSRKHPAGLMSFFYCMEKINSHNETWIEWLGMIFLLWQVFRKTLALVVERKCSLRSWHLPLFYGWLVWQCHMKLIKSPGIYSLLSIQLGLFIRHQCTTKFISESENHAETFTYIIKEQLIKVIYFKEARLHWILLQSLSCAASWW